MLLCDFYATNFSIPPSKNYYRGHRFLFPAIQSMLSIKKGPNRKKGSMPQMSQRIVSRKKKSKPYDFCERRTMEFYPFIHFMIFFPS